MTDADFARGQRDAHRARRAGVRQPAQRRRRHAARAGPDLRRRRCRSSRTPRMGCPTRCRCTHSGAMATWPRLGVATTGQSSAGLPVCAGIDEVLAAVARARRAAGASSGSASTARSSRPTWPPTGTPPGRPAGRRAGASPTSSRPTPAPPSCCGIEVQVGRTGVITPVAVLDAGAGRRRHRHLGHAAQLRRPGAARRPRRRHRVRAPRRRRHPRDHRRQARRAAGRRGAVRAAAGLPALRRRDRPHAEAVAVRPAAGPAAPTSRCTTSPARDAMDIEGLGDKILDALVAAGLVTDPADLYDLDVPTLAGLDRMGTVSATQAGRQHPGVQGPAAVAGADRPRRADDRPVDVPAAGPPLRHHGGAAGRARVEDLQQVEGVGPERAATIAAELVELAPVIAKLVAHGVNMTEPTCPAPNRPDAPTTTRCPVLPLRRPDGTPMTRRGHRLGARPDPQRGQRGGRDASAASRPARCRRAPTWSSSATARAQGREGRRARRPDHARRASSPNSTAHHAGDHSAVEAVLQDG